MLDQWVGATGAPAASPPRGADEPALSVVVPVHNEAGNIAPMIGEIMRVLDPLLSYEIVYVDDGSDDATGAELAAARATCAALRTVRHRYRCGQSAALRSGVRAARAAWVATLDGDCQNDPADIPALLVVRDATGAGPIMVTGVRSARQDRLGKRWASRFANRLRRRLLRDGAQDSGCGIRLFPREAFLGLPYFDHMHRFLPALFIRAGIVPIEQPVNHRPRVRGRSHYGLLDRGLVGIVDLLGVAWLQRRDSRPVIETKDRP